MCQYMAHFDVKIAECSTHTCVREKERVLLDATFLPVSNDQQHPPARFALFSSSEVPEALLNERIS